ncbi:MAG: mechanosensitive ion channel [Tateyamaria sp.]|nr:mechanosensitive ion channel [Tateyamaria sp.]MBT7800935.1 mechanosensitive ion channel [Tateyamaria sp.]
MTMKLIKIIILLSVLTVFLPTLPVMAQALTLIGGKNTPGSTVQELPVPLTEQAVRNLVSRLSDDQVRAMLLERLDAVAKEQAVKPEPTENIIIKFTVVGTGVLTRWRNTIRDLPTALNTQANIFLNFRSKFSNGAIWTLFGLIALTLISGLILEKGAVFTLRRWQTEKSYTREPDLKSAIGFLLGRFGREFLGLLVFLITIRSVGNYLLDSHQIEFAKPLVFYLIWVPRLGTAVSRMLLAPKKPEMRIVNIDDRWAVYLHQNLIGLFLLIGFLLFMVNFDIQYGVEGTKLPLVFWLNVSIHLYIAYIAWTVRAGLTEMMRGSDPDITKFDQKIADAFPYFAILVSLATWLTVEFMLVVANPATTKMLIGGAHYKTMFLLLAAPIIDTTIRGVVGYLQPPMSGDGAIAKAAYVSTKRSYIRIGRMVAVVCVALMLANIWDISFLGLVSSQVGETFSAHLLQFVLTLGLGYVLYELTSVWVNRRLAREHTQDSGEDVEKGGEGGGAGQSRMATVLPLLLITTQAAICVIFGLLAIGALGIDITPLLAGAGILGLAIGFGAQKLVADIVSGAFFLIDDAFRAGEYLDVGGTMGTVEKISIRSMQLRHHRGLVNTVPYGSIEKVTNFSRDWVIMKLIFTVPFDTDPNKVKKIFKKIGAEMLEDPLYKDDFLEPFKSQGVFQFDDVGIVMRGKFMAKPGTQFTIRKEIYNRVRKEFDANGIEFARREVRVAIPSLDGNDEVPSEQKAAIAGAVSGAVQAHVEEQKIADVTKSKK